jgi:hypothetical protein
MIVDRAAMKIPPKQVAVIDERLKKKSEEEVTLTWIPQEILFDQQNMMIDKEVMHHQEKFLKIVMAIEEVMKEIDPNKFMKMILVFKNSNDEPLLMLIKDHQMPKGHQDQEILEVMG